jgi:hypothetical protein
MKKVFILMSILSLFYVGCKEESNSPQSTISPYNSSNDSLFNSVIRQFALPYPENFRLDSNTIIFYGSRPFDTSFLIHLKKETQKITGVYYEVIPTYHNDLNNYAVSASKLLFFEGYSFILDSSKWKEVKDQTTKLLSDSTTFNIKEACRDCEVYGLYYDSKSNIGNITKYRPYYKFFKEAFLDSFILRRKPIMYKAK